MKTITKDSILLQVNGGMIGTLFDTSGVDPARFSERFPGFRVNMVHMPDPKDGHTASWIAAVEHTPTGRCFSIKSTESNYLVDEYQPTKRTQSVDTGKPILYNQNSKARRAFLFNALIPAFGLAVMFAAALLIPLLAK